MRRRSMVWIASIAIGAAMTLHAHAGESVAEINPNVANAHWDDYKDMYPTSALCKADEITLWTCDGNKKTYSLCSSTEITEDTGYIQYRAGNEHGTTFLFPEHKRHPGGIFRQSVGLSGDAHVKFKNGDYSYTLVDRLRGTSSITVSKDPGNTGVADIECSNANQSLQLNYTLKLMKLSGVADR